jgi:hypothetical protein
MVRVSQVRSLLIVVLCSISATIALATEPGLAFNKTDDRIVILNGGQTLSEYVFADPVVPRPYLINVKTLDGIQVTRNHPVQSGDDHDHPHHTGIFFTFGDLNGIDFWHLKGRVVHERFAVEPRTVKGAVGFAVENRYESLDGSVVFASERAVLEARLTDDGILYNFHNLITPHEKGLIVGSKEEGGLAVRVATPIAISSNSGGRMVDADGRSGGAAIWGQQTDWVDYSGTINDRYVGILIVPHKRNFSRCWWHARDYGLLAGNPFGPLNQKGQRHLIHRGHTLVLRYDVLIHSSPASEAFHLSDAAGRVLAAQK